MSADKGRDSVSWREKKMSEAEERKLNQSSLNMSFGEFTLTPLSLWAGYARNWTFKISILFFLLHQNLSGQKLAGAFKAKSVFYCWRHLFEN